ncbi:hypothetical protein [Kistimonas scapharcae]|uniref:hypothetical protein n=1 Tax=Kistimonas scapharcae TaxID=1036133 RepID=UPI0031E51C4F
MSGYQCETSTAPRIPRRTINDRDVVPEPARRRVQQPRINQDVGVDNRRLTRQVRTEHVIGNTGNRQLNLENFEQKLGHYYIRIPDRKRLEVLTNNNLDLLHNEHFMNAVVLYLACQRVTSGFPDDLCYKAILRGLLDGEKLEAVKRGESLNNAFIPLGFYAAGLREKVNTLDDDTPIDSLPVSEDFSWRVDDHNNSIPNAMCTGDSQAADTSLLSIRSNVAINPLRYMFSHLDDEVVDVIGRVIDKECLAIHGMIYQELFNKDGNQANIFLASRMAVRAEVTKGKVYKLYDPNEYDLSIEEIKEIFENYDFETEQIAREFILNHAGGAVIPEGNRLFYRGGGPHEANRKKVNLLDLNAPFDLETVNQGRITYGTGLYLTQVHREVSYYCDLANNNGEGPIMVCEVKVKPNTVVLDFSSEREGTFAKYLKDYYPDRKTEIINKFKNGDCSFHGAIFVWTSPNAEGI